MSITQQQIQAAAGLQHVAAHDTSNQVRLIAGPGTGKSFSIEERVFWLLNNQVAPNRIFAVSFTRASARDLQSRIEGYCQARGLQTAGNVSVTTLHSLALRILRTAGLLTYPANPTVLDRWEVKEIYDAEFSINSGIRLARCDEIRREHEAFWSTGHWGPPNYVPPNPQINQGERNAFNQFHGPRAQTYSCVLPGEIIRQCVSNIANGVLDPVALLGIEHLIIDEFQDLNPCDLEFVDQMIRRGVITFVAGDDDQSIYSFRFAAPQGIQDFTTNYPGAGDHRITDCFRCTPEVVSAANAVINAHPVPNRIQKNLNSLYTNSAPPLQGLVGRWGYRNGVLEAQAIAASCNGLIQAGIQPRDILILLSNTTILGRDVFGALAAAQIPYERPKANSFIESQEGRLPFTLLRIICNHDDYIAHRSLLGLLVGVGVRTCNGIADKVVANNLNFVDIFHRPLPAGVFSVRELNAIRRAQGIATVIDGYQKTETLAQRDNDIQAILGNVLGQPSQQAWTNAVAHLPQDITLEELRDYLWADTDEQEAAILENVYQRLGLPIPQGGVLPQKVRIMTMHGAKGLSAKAVFIPGLEEQVFPGQWRIPFPGLVFEAARLLYVSVSRARAACIMSYATHRIVYGRIQNHAPSRFTVSLGGAFAQGPAGGLSQLQITQIMNECMHL